MSNKNKNQITSKANDVKITKLENNPEAQKTLAKVEAEKAAAKAKEEEMAAAARKRITAEMQEKAENPDSANKPETKKPETKKTADKKIKTQGIFQITSKFDPTIILKGASSQIEICTRDYMSWCLKGKAPKIMQAEYDTRIKADAKLTPADIFEVKILKACPKADDLKAAKVEYGINQQKTGNQPTERTLETTLAEISSAHEFINVQIAKISPETGLEDDHPYSDLASKLEEIEDLLKYLISNAKDAETSSENQEPKADVE